jgi:hypothetical protein
MYGMPPVPLSKNAKSTPIIFPRRLSTKKGIKGVARRVRFGLPAVLALQRFPLGIFSGPKMLAKIGALFVGDKFVNRFVAVKMASRRVKRAAPAGMQVRSARRASRASVNF